MEMMMTNDVSETAKAVVRRNTIEVQGGGNWELFDELFADDFHDHTPQPGGKPDKAGVLELYRRLRDAFPDFTPEIHWQTVDGDVVTFLGVPGTGRKVSFETVDAMRVVDGRITEHWGVANLYSVMQQLGVLASLP
jgi:predicted SnoaL-like aldol condensation-catalyzing enzyme